MTVTKSSCAGVGEAPTSHPLSSTLVLDESTFPFQVSAKQPLKGVAKERGVASIAGASCCEGGSSLSLAGLSPLGESRSTTIDAV
jgi:hypothetical protein